VFFYFFMGRIEGILGFAKFTRWLRNPLKVRKEFLTAQRDCEENQSQGFGFSGAVPRHATDPLGLVF
jgi:hypothetical protein